MTIDVHHRFNSFRNSSFVIWWQRMCSTSTNTLLPIALVATSPHALHTSHATTEPTKATSTVQWTWLLWQVQKQQTYVSNNNNKIFIIVFPPKRDVLMLKRNRSVNNNLSFWGILVRKIYKLCLVTERAKHLMHPRHSSPKLDGKTEGLSTRRGVIHQAARWTLTITLELATAQVTVECADTKLASHVQDWNRNLAAPAVPLQF